MATEKSREELAEIFRNRARPDENDFQDLFESFINKVNDQVRVGANKNIGIGVTGNVDPAAKLHVQGDFKLQYGEIVKNISKNIELITSEVITGETEAQTSDVSIPTQAAVKTYVDSNISMIKKLLVGCVLPFACKEDKIPEGWLLCDGRMLDKNDYPLLFEKIGTKYGSNGDPASPFFCVPNLVDRFIRGGDNSNFGELQDDAVQDHSHSVTVAEEETGGSGKHFHYMDNEPDKDKPAFSDGVDDDYEPPWNDTDSWKKQTSRIKFGEIANPANHGGMGFGLTFIGFNPNFGNLINPDPSLSDTYKKRDVYDLQTKSNGSHTHSYTPNVDLGELKDITDPHDYRYADETRPKNISLIYCIKY